MSNIELNLLIPNMFLKMCCIPYCSLLPIHIYYIRIRQEEGYTVKTWPEPKRFPEGAVQVKSQGLRPYFTVNPDLNPYT